MKAHVICMNDSPRYVIVDNDDEIYVAAKIVVLAKAQYDKEPSIWESYAEYRRICHWHIRTVNAE